MRRRTRSSGGSGCGHVAALPHGAEQLVQVLARALAKPERAPEQQARAAASGGHGCYECVQCGCRAHGSSQLHCGHVVFLDRDRVELFCAACGDYVYMDEFDRAVQLYAALAMAGKGRPLVAPPSDPVPKRQRTHRADEALASGGDASTATGEHLAGGQAAFVARDGFPLGLRGLNNLGNTCFMNSVLQVLFQVPLLRNFYLGEGHDPSSCRCALRDKPCVSCQMDGVFGEVYSGKRAPYSPADFLYHWWLSDEGLAGYQQHDAHEFFLSLLDKLDRGSLVADAAPVPGQLPRPEPRAGGGAACGAPPRASPPPLLLPPAAAQQQQRGPSPAPEDSDAALHGGRDGSSWRDDDDGCSTDSGYIGTGGRPSPAVYGRAWGGVDGVAGLDMTPEPPDVDPRPPVGVSLVSQAFMGLMRSDVTCCACAHVSSTFQSFTDLSLDIHIPRPPRRAAAARGAGAGAPAAAPGDGGAFGDPRDGHATPSPTPPPSDFLVAPSGLSGLASGMVSGGPSGLAPAARGAGAAAAGGDGDGDEGPLSSAAPAATASSEGSQEGGAALSHTLRRGRGAGAGRPAADTTPEPRSGSGGAGGAANGVGDASDSDGVPSELGGAAASQSSQQQRTSAAAAAPAPAGPAADAAPHERPRRSSAGGAARLARAALGGADAAPAAGAAQPGATGTYSLRTRHSQPGDGQADPSPAPVPVPTHGIGTRSGSGALAAAGRLLPNGAWGVAPGQPQQQQQQHDQQAPAAPAAPAPVQPPPAAAGARARQSGQGDSAAVEDVGEVSSPARPVRSGATYGQGGDSFGFVLPPHASNGSPAAALPFAAAPAGGHGKGKKGRGPQPRVTRCGECHTCRNKHLKKACERNKALREAGIAIPAIPAPQPFGDAPPPGAGAGAGAPPGAGGGPAFPSYDALTAAALRQGLLRQRDPKGRFIPKQQLSRYAAELVRRGLMQVPPGVEPPAPAGAGDEPVDDLALAWAGAPVQVDPALLQAAAAGPGPGAGPGGAAPGGGAGGEAGRSSQPLGAAQHMGAGAGSHMAKKPAPAVQHVEEVSLLGCLRRFIRPDRVTGHTCSSCGATGDATKQVSLRRLPPVLCLHVKRFKLDERHNRLYKLQVPLSFPLGSLDMSPFLSSSVLRAAALPRAAGAKRAVPRAQHQGAAQAQAQAPQPQHGDAFLRRCSYDLFGVVSHRGDMSAGHYVAYVKAGGCWYKCDDAWVLLADGEEEVGRCQAYMLFYQQRAYAEQQAAGGGGGGAPGGAAGAAVAAAARAAAAGRA